jgi:cell division protein FtsI/penicillin-binding protein 2
MYIQIALKDLGRSINERSSIKQKDLEAVRGNIYDRWGNLLAGNVEVYEIGVDLIHLVDATEEEKMDLANFLSSLTELNAIDIYNRINIPYDKQLAVFSTIYKDAPKEMIEKIIEAREKNEIYKSIAWNGRLTRRYPEGSLAANVLGFYASEGYYGVEEYFENMLATPSQKTEIYMAPYQPIIIPEIPHGASVMLTIDREIQSRTEKILDAAVENNGAASGTIIIMDPRNGEILSMATTPRADLNLPANLILSAYPELNVNGETIQTPFNRAIMQTYEPGSVFKVITMAAAIDAGVVTPDTPFIDTGYVEIYGAPVQNWDYGAWGPQTMTTCMQHSLNVCLASVAKMLDIPGFYSYLNAFNIDRKTNIDLNGERNYPLLSPQNPTPFGSDINAPKWDERMLAYQSFGQGVAVTPIRMVSSISALANEGRIMAPHVQKAIIQGDKIRYFNPMIVSTPIKPETAKTMTDMLAISLEIESSDALVDGYRLAGKTGTAEIPTLGGYTENLTNASFVGWGPVDDPEFIVYVWLEKPTTSIWSSVVAAPVFRDVVEELVILLDIPPDEIRLQMANQ